MFRYLAMIMLILGTSLLASGCGGDTDQSGTDDATTTGEADGPGGGLTADDGTSDDVTSGAGTAGDATSTDGDSADTGADTGDSGANVGLGSLWKAVSSGVEDTLADDKEGTPPPP